MAFQLPQTLAPSPYLKHPQILIPARLTPPRRSIVHKPTNQEDARTVKELTKTHQRPEPWTSVRRPLKPLATQTVSCVAVLSWQQALEPNHL